MLIQKPIEKGNINLKSRIVFPPMATHSSESGVPGEKTAAHYLEIAKNPLVSLIVTEHSFVDAQGKADPNQISFASDEVINPQKKMTDKIHAANPEIKIFAQISHAGAATSSLVTGEELVSASDIQVRNDKARALSTSEIHEIEQKFADAALRVKKSGYDGVEIHSAHGYLLNEFYSPLTNFRDDEYGAQNIENRTRFLTETIQLVRETVGKDFPVSVRFGGSDYTSGGSTISDAAEAAVLIEKAGADLIDISGGMCGFMIKGNRNPGWFSEMSRAVKEKVSVPVLVTGGITETSQAEEILSSEKADLVGVGRALFRNPKWGN